MEPNNHTIPPGWRKLRREEMVIKGDKYSIGTTPGWKECIGSIGSKPYEFQLADFIFIRKEEQKQDKEWLNPWDNL